MRQGIWKISIFVTISFLLINCGTKNYALFKGQTNQKQNIKIKYEYKILPNDRISVTVFRHPELSTHRNTNLSDERGEGVLVSQNGTVVLPLIGEVYLKGLTVEEAQKVLTEKYKIYLKHPEVYVEILNKRIYVLGEVAKPGVIPIYNGRITLIDALAQAGDLNFYGKRNQILIIRGGLNNPQIIKVDLTNIKSLKNTTMNLMPNDIVYVPPNNMRQLNVTINEISPLLRLISDVLNPFVQIKFLSQ